MTESLEVRLFKTGCGIGCGLAGVGVLFIAAAAWFSPSKKPAGERPGLLEVPVHEWSEEEEREFAEEVRQALANRARVISTELSSPNSRHIAIGESISNVGIEYSIHDAWWSSEFNTVGASQLCATLSVRNHDSKKCFLYEMVIVGEDGNELEQADRPEQDNEIINDLMVLLPGAGRVGLIRWPEARPGNRYWLYLYATTDGAPATFLELFRR